MTLAVLEIVGVVFFASLVRSTFGFGEALLAVPLLSFLVPVKVATPLATLASVTVAVIVVIQDHDKIHLKSAALLLVTTFLGIPIGLFLLTRTPELVVKSVLAVFLILFSSFCLLLRDRIHLRTDRSAPLFGFGAGILGGLYGMNGPLLVIFGASRRWSPQHFRATLQGYFLPASLMGLAGFWASGLWGATVTRYYLLSAPLIILAVLVGRRLNRRLSGRAFTSYIYVGLILLGTLILIQAYGRRETDSPRTPFSAGGRPAPR